MRLIAIFLTAAVCGCAGGNSQIATCQAEKEQLLTTIRSQRDQNRELGDQVVSLEARLDQAEKALAQGHSPTRISKGKSEPAPGNKTASVASLSWRNPESSATSEGTAKSGGDDSARVKLGKLAKQDGRVKFDPRANSARIELPLNFREQGAALTAEDKLQLDEVARLLKFDEARELPVIVSAASAERAKSVADYLDRHGIAGERLQIAADTSAHRRSVVQIEIQGPDGTVVGRPSAESKRR